MKQRCIEAVAQAIGRMITSDEARDIEARILRNMRRLAADDPARFNEMSAADRLKQAASLSAKELIREAENKKQQVELSIRAKDRLENYISEQAALGMNGLDAVERTLVFKADGKSNTLSAESRGNAIKANATRQLIDTFEAVDPRFWGLLENNDGIAALTKAIFGEETGNAVVDKGGKAWRDVAEQMRAQFESAGGTINRLENWNLPQHHSQLKVSKAGRDAWVSDVFGALDREKYTDELGRIMPDQDVVRFLREAWLSIATGGINQMTPGGTGQSMLANRRNFHREIHFKDAASYLDYQKKYGEKSLWGVITGHIEGLSLDIAMLDTYGPNPDHTFRLLLEKQFQEAVVSDPTKTKKLSTEARKLQDLYDYVAGQTKPVVSERMASGFDTLRNWFVASRLGSAAITAISDEATIHLTAHVNNLPELQLFRNELAAFNIANSTEKNLAHRAGLSLDALTGHLNRWGQDNLGSSWSNKMASSIMRASGIEALDGARRRAFGTTMMSALGETVGKYERLADLDPTDHRILLSKGVTEENWSLWKRAELEQWGAGNGVLTPESIMRIPDGEIGTDAAQAKQEAVLRLLGVVLEETDMAVIRPGLSDRFVSNGGWARRGTVIGELARSVMIFKSFPIAMVSRHFMRGLNQETVGGKALYIASLIAGTTILGAAAQSVNDLLSGKDVRNYNPFSGEHGGKNWMAALLKGGGLGIYGDFLLSQTTQHSQQGVVSTMLGPFAGLVDAAMGITQGNLIQLAQGKDTHLGAEMVQFVKGNLPGANLWYAKAALDHLVFNQLQEYFSPGYLSRMEQRARKDFGQTYFWSPRAGLNNIGKPDFNKAIGR